MSGKNNDVGTKIDFAQLPDVPIANKLTAAEFNQVADFQKSPVQQETIFVDTSIVIDGTKEYSTTKVIAGATHTITAATSGHVQGNELRVLYQFDVDCTLTLVNFESTGNNTGTITPIPAGSYDFKFKANARGVNLVIPQNATGGVTLADGSGTTANGNAVDLGGTQSGDVIIKKADSETFKVIRADDSAGDWQELILNANVSEFHQLDTTNGWLGGVELGNEFFANFLGGAVIFARDNPITKLAGLACLADGTIMIGDLSNGSGTFTKMFFKHDYSAAWDALSAAEKDRIITDFGYQFENFLSKLDTAAQNVVSKVSFQDVINFSVGSVSLPSITFIGDTNTGTYHPESDAYAITAGGVEGLRVSETGGVIDVEVKGVLRADGDKTTGQSDLAYGQKGYIDSEINIVKDANILKNRATNGNLVSLLDQNWGAANGALKDDIPSTPQFLIEQGCLVGYMPLANYELYLEDGDSFTLPLPGDYFKWSYFIYIEAGNYPPTTDRVRAFIFRDGAGQFTTDPAEIIKVQDNIYKIEGYVLLDFAEDVTGFYLESVWEVADRPPSGDIYVTGLVVNAWEADEYYKIDRNFEPTAAEEIENTWDNIKYNRGNIQVFLNKYQLKEVDANNQLNILMIGDSIFGRMQDGEISNSPGEATGLFPPNMWQQLVSYKLLESLQFNTSDVVYTNLQHSDWTKSGTWALNKPTQDNIRIYESTTATDYLEITVSGVSFFKFIYYTDASGGTIYDVLVNGVLPSVLGITGEDQFSSGTSAVGGFFKWANKIYSDLDIGTSYTFRFTNLNGSRSQIWGCETWSKERINVINQGIGGYTAGLIDDNLHQWTSSIYNPDLIINELPLLNDSFDASNYKGEKVPSSAGISASAENFIYASETGVYTNYSGLTLNEGEYSEYDGADWQVGSPYVNNLIDTYVTDLTDYMKKVSEMDVEVLIFSPHKTQVETRVWMRTMLKLARNIINSFGFAFVDFDYKYQVVDYNINDGVADGIHLNDEGVQRWIEVIEEVLDPTIDYAFGVANQNVFEKKGDVLTAGSRTVTFDIAYKETPEVKIQAYDDGSAPSFMYIDSVSTTGFVVVGSGAFKWNANPV